MTPSAIFADVNRNIDRLRFWRPVWSAQGSLDAHATMFRDNLTAAHASNCPEGRRIWLGMAAANLATWRERLDEAELAVAQLAEHLKRVGGNADEGNPSPPNGTNQTTTPAAQERHTLENDHAI